MAVLETTIKRFIGLSGDRKPTIGLQPADSQTVDPLTTVVKDLPAGSTFFEEDTGDIWRWNGFNWTLPQTDASISYALAKELLALRKEVCALRLGMIEAGHCETISDRHIERELQTT